MLGPLGVLAILRSPQVHRMKQAGLMHQVGIGANNGGLYALKEPPTT